jgi:ribosomal protein L44E
MTGKTLNTKTTTMDWLMHRNRKGLRRIETLTFGRLNRIYIAQDATPAIRQAIRNECRRCGYTLAVLELNRWN